MAEKWPLVYNKIDESLASIVCFQETKKGEFSLNFIKKFAPKFASGGLLVLWAGNMFTGTVVQRMLWDRYTLCFCCVI